MPIQKITPEIAKQMQADRDAGMNLKKVAKKYRCGTGTVSMFTEQPEWTKRNLPLSTIYGMQADRDAGMSTKDIADKYHVSLNTVYKRTMPAADGIFTDGKDYFSADERETFIAEWDYWRLRILRECGRDV